MRSLILFFGFFPLILVGNMSAEERSASVPSGTPIPCNQRSFSIPFEVRNDGASDPAKEIELLYSSDRGARWFSAKRIPIEAKKFDFTAPSDGEYWFIFRMISLSGVIKATNQSSPQLRVLVDTAPQKPIRTPPSTAAFPTTVPETPPNPLRSFDEPGPQTSVVPLTPPKPSRKPPRHETAKTITDADEPVVPQHRAPGTPPPLFSPSGEVVPIPTPTEKTEKKRSVDPLLAEMSRFYETLPKKNESPASDLKTQTSNPESRTPPPDSRAPGMISGVSLGEMQQQPRVLVRWNAGDESWKSAYADVLRGNSPQGPWLPIATNLPNNGEYWWFVTKEDYKPFYVSLRLRLPPGTSTSDTTRSPIRIEPEMFNSTVMTTLR